MQSNIALQLLDSSQSYPLQTWEFSKSDLIELGRATHNHIQIGHPTVSRAHATIAFEDGKWTLQSISKLGVLVDGERVMQVELHDSTLFQLSSQSPFLKFVSADPAEESTQPDEQNQTSTLYFDFDSSPLLDLDLDQRDRDVQEIIEDPYFDQLKKLTDQIKQRQTET